MRHAEEQLFHDLRNAALVIRGASLQLSHARDTLTPDMLEHLTEMISRRSDMLVQLVGDLSLVQQVGRGDLQVARQRVDLADTCSYTLADLTDGARVEVDVPDDAAVLGDPVRVTQVIDNLVTNALRYGGAHVELSAVREGPLVHLDVRDDGPGVPADLLDSIFEAYSRGPDSARRGGSGLGLAIVRELCEAMGGSVAYDGSRGAHFRVTLPAVPVLDRLEPDRTTGHAVVFWEEAEEVAERVAAFAHTGFAAGEAVVLATRDAHTRLVFDRLERRGIDVAQVRASGQLVLLDADRIHHELRVGDHVDPGAFERLLSVPVRTVRARWRDLRVFGEIVDLYWRTGDDHLALETESCWNSLRARVPFTLLCGYELGEGAEHPASVCELHDAVA